MEGKSVLTTILCLGIILVFGTLSYAAHPLITDDSGVQGKNKFNLEFDAQTAFDNEDEQGVEVKTRATEFSFVISRGVSDNIDVIFAVPYSFAHTQTGDIKADENGFSDVSFELKWKFYEKDNLALSIKPGLTFPTGNEEKGLGAGEVTGALTLITTIGDDKGAIHINLGYIRNENESDAAKDIWHLSVAGQKEAAEHLQFVGNIGIERNEDKDSDIHPAFALIGLIYEVNETISVDLGVKAGLTKTEDDMTVLAGLTWGF